MGYPLKNRQILLKRRPVGLPNESDYEVVTSPVTPLEPGELLMRNDLISLDPAIRGWMSADEDSYMPPIALGDPVRSSTLSTVVASRNPDYEVGDLVLGLNAWEEYTKLGDIRHIHSFATKMPKDLGVPNTWLLSVLGATGMTAYFGLLYVGEPKPGDTVLVSSAAGAVGSIVGQIAKLKGCRVVGIAGSDEKCRWLKDELGFDDAINYKDNNNRELLGCAIAKSCPEGVDIYFENVGGYFLEAVLDNIAERGRVIICGLISQYNEEVGSGPENIWKLLVKSARIEGFLIRDYVEQMPEAALKIGQWLAEGKIRNKVDLHTGFDNIPASFLKLFSGRNQGKLIVELEFDRE
ncbi:NADP-dependent oxidoreductase [Shewanella corallii]|uniref:NADP-dependent oxidoreductase n=1 Tax=Shewanella corallii TaxID=560080 RepID=A0ABT0NAU8_9GAMM|nr:NADP-dependent oxidoreductase [Shewanella corallii]MCL2915480.1 NADP-dependent oxidoreductase [Shewanella corallii]